MLRFENIGFAYAFLLIPVFILLYIWMGSRRRKALKEFGDTELISRLTEGASKAKPVLKFIVLQLALFFLIIGIINPQIGSKLTEVKREGSDIIITLDVSNSMKAEDIAPNRLQRAKQAIEKLVDKLEGDRIGLVVFAGQAYVQLPITTDYAAAKLFLQNIETDIVPTQGTAIGTAIDLAVESFGADNGKNRAIVVITDGENHEDDAIRATQSAVENNITVHTIGIGSVNGTPIPQYNGHVQIGFKKDKEGNTVITKLNEQILQEISAAGNGIYVHASGSELGLNTILSELKKLDKKEFESKLYVDYDDKFYYFIWIALVLLAIDFFITEIKSKWVEKLNLFGERRNNNE